MSRRLEDLWRRNQSRLERLTGTGAEPRGRPVPSSRPPTGRRWRLADASPQEWEPPEDYFQPGDAMLWQITQFIFNAPHVQSNELYRPMAKETMFYIDARNPEVNAFANLDEQANQPFIVVRGGCVAFSRLCGLASVADRPDALAYFCGSLGQVLAESGCSLSPSGARVQADRLGIADALGEPAAERRANSLAAGVMAGVVAHELGHVLHGHVHRREKVNNEVSRNMEREADLFAASVINSSPWGEHAVAGMVVWNVAQAWLEHLAGGPAATTHPYSAERALDLVRANESQAKSAGLTAETVARSLPPLGKLEAEDSP